MANISLLGCLPCLTALSALSLPNMLQLENTDMSSWFSVLNVKHVWYKMGVLLSLQADWFVNHSHYQVIWAEYQYWGSTDSPSVWRDESGLNHPKTPAVLTWLKRLQEIRSATVSSWHQWEMCSLLSLALYYSLMQLIRPYNQGWHCTNVNPFDCGLTIPMWLFLLY